LHEFRQRVGKERAFVLSGNCSPDGQQTPFLPFIEVVRRSFRVSAGEAEKDIAQKLEMGLGSLGLHSARNVGLLLHLLGLKVPGDALAGLDGVLIGLRTRELLQQLLEARCGLSSAVMVIEDLHWIDSASEEVLGKIVGSEAKLRLLLLTTHRPEYVPLWLDSAAVTKLHLEPLPAGDIRRLAEMRLGVEALPEALARQLTDKAEGNPLFAEEIVSYLSERGILRTAAAGKLEFDASAVAAALPASIQSLLTARVDRLAPQDRALLQAAAVIGRRFDAQLLAVTAGETVDIDARLAATQALDLVHPEGKSSDYVFKHVLVRDALYQSLLSEARAALHVRIAEEIERRNGNRLTEVAEVLAYHYNQTERVGKAFTYLAMAGGKGLGVYSLEEADNYFAAAVALLDKNSDCASDQQIVDLLVDCTLCLHLLARFESLTEIVARFMLRLDRLGADPKCILVQHHYVIALLWSGRYREAEKAQGNLTAMAARLHDAKSRAYALASAIHVWTITASNSVEVFDAVSREASTAASNVDDAYLQCFLRYVVGWKEMHHGRMTKAHEAAEDLMAVGRRMNDPRSIGFAMQLEHGLP
jgi:predicted ATPase